MTEKIRVHECQMNDICDCDKSLWLSLAHKMLEIDDFTLSSEESADLLLDSVCERLAVRLCEKLGFHLYRHLMMKSLKH